MSRVRIYPSNAIFRKYPVKVHKPVQYLGGEAAAKVLPFRFGLKRPCDRPKFLGEAIDLAGIAKQINVDVSTDGINQMVSALVNAYMAQVSPTIDPENPPDMNTLLTGFVSFAMSGQGQAIMAAHAGNIVKEAAKLVGGGGGGRPNMAQAGGKNPAGIKDALDKAVEVLKNQIK